MRIASVFVVLLSFLAEPSKAWEVNKDCTLRHQDNSGVIAITYFDDSELAFLFVRNLKQRWLQPGIMFFVDFEGSKPAKYVIERDQFKYEEAKLIVVPMSKREILKLLNRVAENNVISVILTKKTNLQDTQLQQLVFSLGGSSVAVSKFMDCSGL